MDEKDEEGISKDCLGIFKEVGFVFSTPEGIIPGFGEIKDGHFIVRGVISVYEKDHSTLILSFDKRKPMQETKDLDKSPDIELSEDKIIFGYRYKIEIPKNQITKAQRV